MELYDHGYMNNDCEPMTFAQVTSIAKQLCIPDFKVLELNDYCELARSHHEPTNCVIYIPHDDNPNTGHYVGAFTCNNCVINYQDSYGQKVNPMPQQLRNTGRKFKVNRVKYQSYFSNNCGYLALLHVATHDKVDPCVKRV